MITLPNCDSNEGIEARVLLAECPTPAASSYTFVLATEAMQLMDAVLRNRLQNPGRFGAKGAKTLLLVVRAKNQFAGFEKYPEYSLTIKQRIQDAINIANSTADVRSASYTEYVEKAIEIAKFTKFSDPSPGKLVSWRTANSSSPGKNFLLFKTVLGNDFYYQ